MSYTPEQQAQIKSFVDNGAMFAAVRAVLLPDDDNTKTIDRAIDDAEYGRKVKVAIEVRESITERFEELSRIASGNPQPVSVNQAR